MKFARFWSLARISTGRKHPPLISCWGWSQKSEAEAAARARERGRRIVDCLASGRLRQHRYGYGERPLREPVLRELRNEAGEVIAVVTRNSYGCLVLNTARLMFVDIDVPELEHSSLRERLAGAFRRLCGRSASPPGETALAARLDQVEQWTRRRPEWSWRVYRTRAGLRLVATHAEFDPRAAATQECFAALGADPLYARLCRNQESFRARLTPKPWRCRWHACPVRWPFIEAGAERRFQAWEREYLKRASATATCRFLKTIGQSEIAPAVSPLLRLHDETTRAESELPLA